jgi:hypothetical protein
MQWLTIPVLSPKVYLLIKHSLFSSHRVCISPPRQRSPSRVASLSPGSRPGGAGLRLACGLQGWSAAGAAGGGAVWPGRAA